MYVKRWNSKTKTQWPTCTFFGSDIHNSHITYFNWQGLITLGSSYDKNATLLCVAIIYVVFLNDVTMITFGHSLKTSFNSFSFTYKKVQTFAIFLSEYEHTVENNTDFVVSDYISK